MKAKQNILVVGFGEIGSAIFELLLEKKSKFNAFKKDIEPLKLAEKIDIMHVNIPYSEKFEGIVISYINQFKPKLTIINSTVRPGTTERIFKKTSSLIVHSPCRGRHPFIKEGLLKFVKFIGPASKKAGLLSKKHFEELGLKAELFSNAVDSEVGKLFETTYYGLQIAFHQEMERLCGQYGADFSNAVKRFSETQTIDINHKIPRPFFFPGFIGGHCVMPNIEILKKDVKSEFLDAIENSNRKTGEKRKIQSSKDAIELAKKLSKKYGVFAEFGKSRKN